MNYFDEICWSNRPWAYFIDQVGWWAVGDNACQYDLMFVICPFDSAHRAGRIFLDQLAYIELASRWKTTVTNWRKPQATY